MLCIMNCSYQNIFSVNYKHTKFNKLDETNQTKSCYREYYTEIFLAVKIKSPDNY